MVHSYCEAIMNNLGEFEIPKAYQGYIDSFKLWWGEGRELLACEQRFYSDELMLTGQVDIIYKKGDKTYIADLKTSYAPSDTWEVQGCAYAYLANQNGYDVDGIEFIHLDKSGRPPTVYEFPIDEDLFFSVFTTYLHFYAKR